GLSIPDVHLVNNDNDTAGVTFSTTAGLVTSESGGTDSFTVQLNTKPTGTVRMSIASSDSAEATVSTNEVVFTTTDWNTPHPVTVTGVDDGLLDFSRPYTIVTGNLVALDDPPYNGLPTAGVTGVNLDDEQIPDAPHAWGNGGCGLTGLEGFLLLALAALRRRR